MANGALRRRPSALILSNREGDGGGEGVVFSEDLFEKHESDLDEDEDGDGEWPGCLRMRMLKRILPWVR